MHLVVKAGYEQESEEQLELAHLLEHMAFVTTKHFSDPYAFMEAKGISRGRSVNAHTNYNLTSYDLEIPSGDRDLLGHSLLFLSDCAHGIVLNKAEVDVQRSPVIRELASKVNVMSDMEHEYAKMAYRNPGEKSMMERIGNLRAFRQESLEKFYNDWYRPDLQAIVIVGDVDLDEMEKRIQSIFQDLNSPTDTKPNPFFENRNDSMVSEILVIKHEKMDHVRFLLTIDFPFQVVNTVASFQRDMMGKLFNIMMRQRLAGINVPGADSTLHAINIAFGDRHLMGSDFFSLRIQSTVAADYVEEGFKNSVRQLKDVWDVGFSRAEFDGAVRELTKAIEDRDESSSAIAGDIEKYFVYGDVVSTKDQQRNLFDRMLREISVADFNRTIKEMTISAKPDIVFFAPGSMRGLPEPETIGGWLREVRSEKAIRRSGTLSQMSLMNDSLLCPPRTASILLWKYSKEARIASIQLANGMNVYVKFSSKRAEGDFMYLHGFRALTERPSKDHVGLQNAAASLVGTSGLGELNAVQLSTLWSKYSGNIRPYFGKNGAELAGAVPEEHAEYLFQAAYLYLSKPKIDAKVFREKVKHMPESESQPKTANEILSEEISKQQGSWNSGVSNQRLAAVGQDSLLRVFDDAFGGAEGYNFVIAGVTDSATFMSLVERYLGCIPAGHRSNSGQGDVGAKGAYKNARKVLNGAREGTAQIVMSYTRHERYDYKRYLETRLLARVLQGRLMYRLRDVHGGTYYVGVRSNAYEYPTSQLSITIGFECDNTQYEQMMAYVIEEIDLLRTGHIKLKDFNTALAIEQEAMEYELTSGRFWLTYLVNQIQIDNNRLSEALTWMNQLKKLRLTDVKKVARRCLGPDNLSSFVVLPGKKKDSNNLN